MASTTSSNSMTGPVYYEKSSTSPTNASEPLSSSSAGTYADTAAEPQAPIICGEEESELTAKPYNEEALREALARMFIIDGLPIKPRTLWSLSRLIEVLEPRFKVPPCITVMQDCLLIYKKEEKKLKEYLVSNHQRVCLTTTIWTTVEGLDYMCLTAHYIHNEWRLQKKIINFCQVEDREGDTIGKAIEECLVNWGIKKVLTITTDKASSSDSVVEHLSNTVNKWNGTVKRGEFMHMRCLTDILNPIVMEVLEDYHEPISRIRNMVKYVMISPSGLKKFKACMDEEKIFSNKLVFLDFRQRWDTTLFMLEAAEKVQKAFECLEAQDAPYIREFCLNEETEVPSSADWEHVRALIKILRVFYDANLKFSGSSSVTSNSFLRELCLIHSQLRSWSECRDTSLKVMAENTRNKHDRYWGRYQTLNPYLFIAALLDPRHKDRLLKYCFGILFGINMALELTNKVTNTLNELYDEYTLLYPETAEVQGELHDANEMEIDSSKVGVDMSFTYGYVKFLKETDGMLFKTEVDRYLMESCENPCDSSFDVLGWWQTNCSKYRILSYIAKDVFAVPVSTAAASVSAFNTSDHILDENRSYIPWLVQPLICTQSWLSSSLEINLRGEIEEIESDVDVQLMFD